MGLFDTVLVIVIITFLILIVWSRVMNQTMFDTVLEIRDIILNLFPVKDE